MYIFMVYNYIYTYVQIWYDHEGDWKGKTRDSVSVDVATTLASNVDISVPDALSHENICTGASSSELVQVPARIIRGIRVHPHILSTMDALYERWYVEIPTRERWYTREDEFSTKFNGELLRMIKTTNFLLFLLCLFYCYFSSFLFFFLTYP